MSRVTVKSIALDEKRNLNVFYMSLLMLFHLLFMKFFLFLRYDIFKYFSIIKGTSLLNPKKNNLTKSNL